MIKIIQKTYFTMEKFPKKYVSTLTTTTSATTTEKKA